MWQKQAAPNLPMTEHVFLNSNWAAVYSLQQGFKPCRETPEAQAFLPASIMVCEVGNQVSSKTLCILKWHNKWLQGTQRGKYTALISLKVISKILLKNRKWRDWELDEFSNSAIWNLSVVTVNLMHVGRLQWQTDPFWLEETKYNLL